MSKNQLVVHFSTKKLNLLSDSVSPFLQQRAGLRGDKTGTKLSCQFAVPVRRTHSQFRGAPAFSGVHKVAQIANRSTLFQKKLRQYVSAIMDWKRSDWRRPPAWAMSKGRRINFLGMHNGRRGRRQKKDRRRGIVRIDQRAHLGAGFRARRI